MSDKKVSVIMASYLGDYPNAATNREQKFIRAVNTFLKQTYQNKELIIVADGCVKTYEIYNNQFSKLDNVKCFLTQKTPTFSGEVRSIGLKEATGEIISYLDADDVIAKDHLEIIMKQFTDEFDLVYYDDYLVLSKDFKSLQKRIVEPRWGSIGTSSITHINFPKEKNIKWNSGYGHDFIFLQQMVAKGAKFKKLTETPKYYVCHWGNMTIPGQFGDF
jgi:glycosyltransferase involved in cell wall biosynthesis